MSDGLTRDCTLPGETHAGQPPPFDATLLLSQIRARVQCPSPATEKFLAEVLRRLIDEDPLSPHAPCVVDGLLEIALHFLVLNRSAEAVAPARAAISKAREGSDPLRLSKALRAGAWALNKIGQFDSALKASMEAVLIAIKEESVVAQAASWNSAGNVLLNAGQLVLASQCYELCLQTDPTEAAATSYRELASANLFTVLLMRGEATESAAAARALADRLEALPSDSDLAAKDRRALLHAAISEVFMAVGDLDEADKHILYARKLVGTFQSELRSTRALKLSTALMSIARGERVALAGIEAGFAHDSTSMHAAVAVCESAGQYDTALEILRRLQERSKSRRLQHVNIQVESIPDNIDLSATKGKLELSQFGVAARLEGELAKKLDRLVEMAVSGSSASGHNLARVFRMSRLASMAARAERFSDQAVHRLGLAAKLCDIGMIAIETSLLRREQSLSAEERSLVSEHTEFGAQLLATANLEALGSCILVARFHHERWDGKGPRSLKGEEIPVDARLIALCDAFDTMTQSRPWRPAFTVNEALQRLMNDSGTVFEPALCERFAALIKKLASEHPDLESFLAADAAENETFVLRMRVAQAIAESRRALSRPS